MFQADVSHFTLGPIHVQGKEIITDVGFRTMFARSTYLISMSLLLKYVTLFTAISFSKCAQYYGATLSKH